MTRSINRGSRIARGCIAIFLTLIAAHQSSLAQHPAFGARCGEELDRDEISYFHLFPSIPDATWARLDDAGHEATDATGRTLRIGRRTAWHDRDTTILVSSEALGELASYLDEFERIYRGAAQIRWPLLGSMVAPSARAPLDGDRIAVELRSGSTVDGRLLTTTDSLLLLWTGEGIYDWRSADSARVIFAENIRNIRAPRSPVTGVLGGAAITASALLLENELIEGSHPIASALPGIFFGGVITIGLIRDGMAGLEVDGNYRAFAMAVGTIGRGRDRDSLPPELRRRIDSARTAPSSAPSSSDGRSVSRAAGRFEISAGMGFAGCLSSPTQYRTAEIEQRIELDVALAPGIRAGIGYTDMPAELSGRGSEKGISLTSVHGHLRYELPLTDRWSRSRFHLWFALGAGISVAKLSTSGTVGSATEPSPASDDALSLRAAVRLDYRFTQLLGTHLQIDALALPGMEIGSNPVGDLSTVGLTIGTSIAL